MKPHTAFTDVNVWGKDRREKSKRTATEKVLFKNIFKNVKRNYPWKGKGITLFAFFPCHLKLLANTSWRHSIPLLNCKCTSVTKPDHTKVCRSNEAIGTLIRNGVSHTSHSEHGQVLIFNSYSLEVNSFCR